MSAPIYISCPRKRAVRASDDWWLEARERLDVIIVDDAPIDTGLVDQYGNPLKRVTSRAPLGFCR